VLCFSCFLSLPYRDHCLSRFARQLPSKQTCSKPASKHTTTSVVRTALSLPIMNSLTTAQTTDLPVRYIMPSSTLDEEAMAAFRWCPIPQ